MRVVSTKRIQPPIFAAPTRKSEIDTLISTCCQQWTHFAEAEGSKGAMIRTWVDIKDRPFIASGDSVE